MTTSAKSEFNTDVWVSVLEHLLNLSDEQISSVLNDRIRIFIQEGDLQPVMVWNFYKELLDLIVRYSAASPFVMSIVDLEPYYEPPPGGFTLADKSIESAPWRHDGEVT